MPADLDNSCLPCVEILRRIEEGEEEEREEKEEEEREEKEEEERE